MSESIKNSAPATELLTKQLAERYIVELTALANQIPLVDYTAEDLLSEHKGDRQLPGKWSHSLITLIDGEPVAFVMAYERESESNEQYPENTIYLSELAVAEKHQGKGLAKDLLRTFFEMNNNIGLQFLEGSLNYSLQTNSADWNQGVVNLYKSFGFKERATKNYPNRTDLVLSADASELRLN